MIELLINTVTGAGTGYITNNIAIKMLFKKYFGKFGGIIEDTHDEFVENISHLIEKDLINHNTLKNEFTSSKFRNYIKELVKDMFLYSLPDNSIDLKDIQGIHDTVENALSFLDKNREHRVNIKKQLASKNLNKALSNLQVLHLCTHIADVVEKNKKTYFSDIIMPLRNFKFNDLITEELFLKVTDNLDTIIYDLDFSQFDTPVDKAIFKLLDTINIDEIINISKYEIENLYLKQIFANEDIAAKNLLEKLLEISLSDEGQLAIGDSVNSILESLSSVDVSILNLLDNDIKVSIKAFIKAELPNIIHKIIEFINENEKDLEILINTSIDKALNQGIFAGLKKKIVSIFYTNIVEEFKIIQMIKEYMNTYQEQAEEEITKQIINILENKSIGEIYTVISKKNILTPEKVITLIIHNLQNIKIDKNFHLIDIVLQKQIKEYTDIDLGFVKSNLIPYSLQKIKTEFLYSDRMKDLIAKETKNIINDFKMKKVDTVLNTKIESITNTLTTFIDQDTLLNTLLKNSEKILEKPINDIVNMDEVNINYKLYIDELIAGKSIKEIITYLQSEEIYIAIESALIKVIVDNLEEILKGNVSEAVKNELTKLPPSQIKDMVEEFMGEELKPINYFGAVLGGVAGAGVGAVNLPLYANPFVYGVVGVATNYLAIKMLFQPYKAFKIGKIKIPFSEGVLPANKEKMAIKMSEFVDEFMLNGTSIQDFFQHNSTKLKDFIKMNISKDNYSIIDKLIHQNSNEYDASNEAVNLLFNFLDNNHELISDKIYTIALTYYEKRQEYSKEASELVYTKVMQNNFKEFLYEQFEVFVDLEKPLTFVSADIFEQLDIFTSNLFDYAISVISEPEKLREVVVSFDDYFDNFISKQPLTNVINSSFKEHITQKINTSLLDLFYGQQTINDLLNFFTQGEFGENSKLSDMINGMLPKIIENNLNLIMNEALLPALKEHKKLIRAEILDKVPFGMKWAVKADVNRTINIILDQEIPAFIDVKIKQINKIIQEILSTKLADFGYTDDVIKQQKVDEMMQYVLSNKNFKASFAKAMDIFIHEIFNMKLKTVLHLFNITKLSEIYDLFEPNILRITEVLNKNIKSEKQDVLQIIKNLTQDNIAAKLLDSLKIGDILKDVDKDLLLREFDYLQNSLKQSEQFQKSLQNIIEKFIKSFMKKEFLDKAVFKEDLQRFLTEIIRDKEQLRDVLMPFFKEFLNNINTILDLKLKDNMLDIIINAAFESIDKKIMLLMEAIDFKKVITKEIQEMHPKELEDMFYSFAGPYFNKLILYGSMGLLFGLATIFPV